MCPLHKISSHSRFISYLQTLKSDVYCEGKDDSVHLDWTFKQNKVMLILYFNIFFALFSVMISCPDDTWITGSDSATCYKISKNKKTWHAAQEWCGQQGGYLAEINTEAEQRFLQTVLRYWFKHWYCEDDLTLVLMSITGWDSLTWLTLAPGPGNTPSPLLTPGSTGHQVIILISSKDHS